MASLEILGSSSMVRELRLVALENSTGVSSSLNATARSSNTLPLTVFEISATKVTHRTQFKLCRGTHRVLFSGQQKMAYQIKQLKHYSSTRQHYICTPSILSRSSLVSHKITSDISPQISCKATVSSGTNHAVSVILSFTISTCEPFNDFSATSISRQYKLHRKLKVFVT